VKKKTNKVQSTFQKIVDKYRIVYFFSFAIGFFFLSIIIGIVLYFSVTNIYFQNAQSSILTYANQYDDFETSKEGPGSKPFMPQEKISYPRLTDPTMTAIVYYTDASGEAMEYEFIGNTFDDDFMESLKEDFVIKSEEEEFLLTIINDYYYISYLREIDNHFFQKEGYTAYLKIYNNVNGELKLRDKFVSLYSFFSIAAFLVSLLLGFIFMKEGTKPLEMFVEKQTNFVSDASHELRTPLAVVQSKIENILSQPDKTVCDVSDDLVISLNEIGRLTKLTSELLTLARNDKDTISINPTVINVDEELKQLLEPFEEIAELNGKKFSYSGQPCYAKLDKDRLKQIVIINVDNALKYTEEGDEISVSVKPVGNEIQIQIADTGNGISDEDKKKIFDRFYRVDKARSRETGGNGLGLAIAYTLVSLQKGTINVYDNVPKGSKFVITFPKAKEKQILALEQNEDK